MLSPSFKIRLLSTGWYRRLVILFCAFLTLTGSLHAIATFPALPFLPVECPLSGSQDNDELPKTEEPFVCHSLHQRQSPRPPRRHHNPRVPKDTHSSAADRHPADGDVVRGGHCTPLRC